ncbi:hypothetical protein OC846_005749 [Tilletia horrida]|uniref:Uncharacterized protein n=1 Tax=Tilletia horrida TaxID=155126 RepID=A0AAN6JVP4_9BASI|nr:hypothetical protein OC846_005749 [Tilletia horrida]KAK0561934.1 hypothetical protein OC861_005571 [Tilletia horrida]
MAPRCVQHRRGSTALALEMERTWPDRASSSRPPKHSLAEDIAAGQRYQYGTSTNVLRRPKYVCWPCRRTFKPTVCHGKQIHHTEKRGNLETTGGQAHLANDPQRSLRSWDALEDSVRHSTDAGPAQSTNTQFSYNPASDGREQTVWVVCDDPGSGKPLEELLPPRIVVTCCPQCGNVGTRIGPNFRAPPRKDVKAWKEAERRTTEEGEHWTFCMGRQEVEWMQELVALVEARMELEGGDKTQEEGGQGLAAASGSTSQTVKRPPAARVSGKHRRREAELRAKLGLSHSEIHVRV